MLLFIKMLTNISKQFNRLLPFSNTSEIILVSVSSGLGLDFFMHLVQHLQRYPRLTPSSLWEASVLLLSAVKWEFSVVGSLLSHRGCMGIYSQG